jgi:ABC-type cobalamin/Fe3+-siderophores transport system ATPase subunit
MSEEKILIGIVGPCKAGKTTLVRNLEKYGYQARQIAQEHSFVPAMWQRITNPDFLVYLEVAYPLTVTRGRLNWKNTDYEKQLERLRHAHEHADLIIQTDPLTPDEVLARVLDFLNAVDT